MPSCENCGKTLGSAKFCTACGTPTLLGRRAQIDETRLHDLASVMTESYTTEPAASPWRHALRDNIAVRLALIGCLAILVGVGGELLVRSYVHARPQMQVHGAQHHAQLPPLPVAFVARKTPAPPTPVPTARMTPTPVPTAAPTPTPTPTPKASPSPTRTTPAPTLTPAVVPSAMASTSAPPHAPVPIAPEDAPAIVQSYGNFSVGTPGSCGGQDVAVAVRDYPRGCTVFRAATSGPLANGSGYALVVPVSDSGSIRDVEYGLLYIRTSIATAPRFLGVLPGDGSGHLVVRVQDGVIMEQNGTHVKYSTFNGRRVVWLSG
jgi:hypothetical protein